MQLNLGQLGLEVHSIPCNFNTLLQNHLRSAPISHH